MVQITRSNPKAFEIIADNLRGLSGVTAEVGWFENKTYDDGTPIAGIAAVQEYGATISHPGGTPIGPHGFVSKAVGSGLPVTEAHTIVIPPRPFMRPTIAEKKDSWLKKMANGAKKILRGEMDAQTVLEAVGHDAAGDITKTISSIHSPPLKKATIRARLNRKSDKKTIGLLDKPLIDTGKLFDSIDVRLGKG